jgi:hypothetical protein
MKSWYKIAKAVQEDSEFYKDDPVKIPTIPQKILNAHKTVEMLDEVIENCTNYHEVANLLTQNGFSWKNIQFPQNNVIAVDIDNTIYVIDHFYLPESQNANEWVNDMWEHELYQYVNPPENDDFWNNVGKGFTVYHATPRENLASIQKEGIQPRNDSRGISNRGTGAAVFTSDNPNDIDYYGDTIVEINVGQMKDDGYMPNVTQETPIEENKIRSALAYKIGIPEYEPQDYYSEGIYDTTFIFYGHIPPKYITVM